MSKYICCGFSSCPIHNICWRGSLLVDWGDCSEGFYMNSHMMLIVMVG